MVLVRDRAGAQHSQSPPKAERAAVMHQYNPVMSGKRRWSQPVDATLYLKEEMECMVMGQRFHRGFTAAEKTELWDRWKRGESLKAIGRAFGKTSVIRCHTRRSTAAYLYKHVACSRKSCLVIFDRSARCVAPSRLIRMAIDGGISRISSQSVSDRLRLKIGRCLVIGREICCPGRTTATSRPWSSVIRVT